MPHIVYRFSAVEMVYIESIAVGSILQISWSNLQVLCHPKNGQFHAFLNPKCAHTDYDITCIRLREIGCDIVLGFIHSPVGK
jgi:hypothetical protein